MSHDDGRPGHRPVPGSKLSRVARLAALGARTGASLVLGRGEEAAAQKAAEVLGNLRGLAAKVGQMASYVDGLVPEGQRDGFESALKVLRSQAPRSSPGAIRARVEEELGGPIHRLFAEFDDDPMASASIGQVHRARLHEDHAHHPGLVVAVKVQHPGIERAVEADLESAGMLESLGATLGARKFDTKAQLAKLRERFREELDYELEATRQRAFARIHEGDEAIVVPRVVASHSSRRVLVSELVHGDSFDDVLALPEGERRRYATTMWRYIFKGNLVGGMFNADPHPGNYLFRDDGSIAFLDYGCVQIIDEPRRAVAHALHRAAIDRDEAAFARAVSKLVDARPGAMEAMARAYSRLCFEPVFASPYRITRAYAASLVSEMREMALEARKVPREEFFTMPPDMLFLNRLQFGFYSVLARLDVDVDYAAIEDEFVAR